jgi:hypothetical protein
LRQHEEEAQRRRDSQERDAAIRNREWVEINLGSVGVVQHVEFADVDVEGEGRGGEYGAKAEPVQEDYVSVSFWLGEKVGFIG